jgi:hypothetical protein
MKFNRHLNLEGKHAFLSPSQHYWLNDSRDKLKIRWKSAKAAEIGTKKHDLARRLIEMRMKMPKTKDTFNAYVNDAIGFRMTPEVILYYNPWCFGTADAIKYDEEENFLRIHDLKTGTTAAKIEQLMIYAAIFCLEYRDEIPDFEELKTELRIYQSNKILIHEPDPSEIAEIMEKIVNDCEYINEFMKEEE